MQLLTIKPRAPSKRVSLKTAQTSMNTFEHTDKQFYTTSVVNNFISLPGFKKQMKRYADDDKPKNHQPPEKKLRDDNLAE